MAIPQGLFGILKQHESRSGYMSETGRVMRLDACVIVPKLALFVSPPCSGRFCETAKMTGSCCDVATSWKLFFAANMNGLNSGRSHDVLRNLFHYVL